MRNFEDAYNELQQLRERLELIVAPEERKELEERIKDLEYSLAMTEYNWLYE